MELLSIVIIILLVVILYKQSARFSRLDFDIRELSEKVDALMRKQERSLSEKEKAQELASKELKAEKREAEVAVSPMIEQVSFVELKIEKAEAQLLQEEWKNQKEKIQGIYQEEVIEETPAPVAKKEKKKVNYEKFIGENLFGKIGILVLVVGIGLFVKYAIDKDWINETLRTILGFVAGAVLLFFAERLCKKYRTFSSLLAGGAFAVFYLTVAIAFHYYHLFSQTMAFVILVSITVLMSALSILYDRRELAVISLAGGFIAPFLVSTGESNYMVLFTYLAVLNLSMFGLSLYKRWMELPLISFAFTYLIMASFVLSEFVFSHPDAYLASTMAGYLLIFATLFYFIFLLPVLFILKNQGEKMNKWLLTVVILNNFIYLGLGTLFLSYIPLSFKPEGLLCLFIALVNFILAVVLRKSAREFNFLVYAQIGLALTFVTIAVPVQLDGNYITLCWASEMVLLLGLYIKSKIRIYETASMILVLLTAFAYLNNVFNQLLDQPDVNGIFLNSAFATCLFTGVATGIYAFMMGRYRDFFTTARRLKYAPWNALMLVASSLMLYYTFMAEFHLYLDQDISGKVMLLFTSGSILLLCYALRNRFPMKEYPMVYVVGIGLTVFVYLYSISKGMYYSALPSLLMWATTIVIIINLGYVGGLYYRCHGLITRFTIYLNVLATLFWLAIVRLFLQQLGLPDELNAGFSVSLAIAGFVQMALGMRLHQKVMRVISLVTFGIVLVKLIFVDLWLMPTVGKIVVFVILGMILLVLSFLYQKLKDVLFKEDDEPAEL